LVRITGAGGEEGGKSSNNPNHLLSSSINGGVDSLNVSVTGGILLWHLLHLYDKK
jgi:hypothetical protein